MADDLRSLCELLREAIAAARLTPREAEDLLGIRHGSLERLLNGRQDIRVRHILALAAFLKVSPGDFLTLGCPGAVESAQHELVEWLSPPVRRRKAAASPTSDNLADRIRTTVREELARLQKGPNGPEAPES